MRKNESKPKATLGVVSVSLLVLLIVTFIPMALWSSQPQFQGSGGMGVGMTMGILMFLAWLPMLLGAFITGGMAIIQNRGRIYGIITLTVISLMFLFSLIQPIFQ